MIKEAIILAGGFGTRLRPVISDLPKPMAPVNGKPFLHYLLSYLRHSGIEKAVLSVGYMAEKIEAHFGKNYSGIAIGYARENEPLGTGGGIRLAMEQCAGAQALVLNGDTFFNVPLGQFSEAHLNHAADATLALRKVHDGSRYGTIETQESRIVSFREKNPGAKGEALINGGVYALRKDVFFELTEANKNFSIEQDFFAQYANKLWLQAFPSDAYFIDIGIPEDYARAQKEFADLKI